MGDKAANLLTNTPVVCNFYGWDGNDFDDNAENDVS